MGRSALLALSASVSPPPRSPSVLPERHGGEERRRNGVEHLHARRARTLAIAHYVIGAILVFLLATIIAPALLPRRSRCIVSIVKTRIVDLADAVTACRRETGELPTSLEALILPDARGHRFLQWHGALADPWNRPHQYEVHADGTFEVTTYGEDGEPGGVGIDQDATLSMVREWQC